VDDRKDVTRWSRLGRFSVWTGLEGLDIERDLGGGIFRWSGSLPLLLMEEDEGVELLLMSFSIARGQLF
jgi:hypothetical protein